MKPLLAALAATTCLAALPAQAQTDRAAVADTYARMGLAVYEDSLTTAQRLQAAVDALIAAPSADTLAAARSAWIAARVPYQQTEAFRFANPVIDDWEGKVNAWPLDEGLIDYVDPATPENEENDFALLNVVSTPRFTLGGTEVDATDITPALLEDTLHEADEIEANVATGYHAVEFMLWGQDLNGTDHGAGNRPWTDYATGDACTNGNCDRRAAYLKAATDLLVSDLAYMVDQWQPGGAARAHVTATPDTALSAMLTGMGSLSYGELAGERMKLGVLLNDPEEEHDCFSDNTHNSHYYDGIGIRNLYEGSYTRIDGRRVEGPSLSDLLAETAPDLDRALGDSLNASVEALGRIKIAAEAGMSYDQMLDRDNDAGGALIMTAVDRLIDQTRQIERTVAALGLGAIEIEGSDALQ